MRVRSVVRSSVTPSAKYSCSGSFDRLAKGRTTIDRRGGGFAAGPVTVAQLCEFAGAWTETCDGPICGHAHQAASPMPTTPRVAATTARAGTALRRAGPGCTWAGTSGVEVTAVALISYARTGRAMFLTLCSPISSNG